MSKQNYKNKQQSNSSNVPHGPAISIHDIEELAYRIHEEKGGTDLDNWLAAERALKEQHS